MPLDPVRTSRIISESYVNYLTTTFRLKARALHQMFEEALEDKYGFSKGPILEATPAFEKWASVSDLVNEGVLSDRFLELNSSRLPPGRALFAHQEIALRKIISRGRNVVVATGTGSGKTETFVIPVLDYLFTQQARGELDPGVRALLLYPMNALANDQMKRLRELLRNTPDITFGRFTGETKRTERAGLDVYREQFHDRPLPNELISRERMREEPPHILLTNYAMLEYLLLRPEDNIFFDGQFARNWRFIVLDEAHTYTGAKGIEMALLIRRLKDRVLAPQQGIQCIATSATLGSGKSDFPEVARFAGKLFGETFEYEPEDKERQDVIQAIRQPVKRDTTKTWLPDAGVYASWWQAVHEKKNGEELIALMRNLGEGANLDRTVLDRASSSGSRNGLPYFLFEVLKGDFRLLQLQEMLEKGPVFLKGAADLIFGDHEDSVHHLVALVDLCNQARVEEIDESLIPARYHMFVRAIEGAYLALEPVKKIYLERLESHKYGDDEFMVFELAACRQCGSGYLAGEVQEIGGRKYLKHPGKLYFEDVNNLDFFLLLDDETNPAPFDEDGLIDTEVDFEGFDENRYSLCGRCGALDKASLIGNICKCQQPLLHTVLAVSSKRGQVFACPACGRTSPSGLVRRFLTGNDATASVLATAFYQEIPPANLPAATSSEDAPNEWLSTPNSRLTVQEAGEMASGRQLLIFSDSRQDAAFFAPYLERTYEQILRRRLILKVIEDHRTEVINNRWRIKDLHLPLTRLATEFGFFKGESRQGVQSGVWKWLIYEFVAYDTRNSLEGLGCLRFSPVKPQGWEAPPPLLKLGLDSEDVWKLYWFLLDSLRQKGAIRFPDYVSPTDDYFAPRNRKHYVVGKKSTGLRGPAGSAIYSWSPASSRSTNSRLNYLTRVLSKLGTTPLDTLQVRALLDDIWSRSLISDDPRNLWKEYFVPEISSKGDVLYQLRPEYWEVQPGDACKWFYCPTCSNLTPYSIHGACPTYRCEGTPKEIDIQAFDPENHYRKLYLGTKPIHLVAREHTAQLTSEAAAELQTQFIQGEVNVLSCSTTFELGVDVGELEAVFMRNVPPSAANYIQRAGRAGRRTSSTAYALTFAQRRSHDIAHFSEPERLIAGRIRAPYFDVANEKIVKRHVYAAAIAAFWKSNRTTYGDGKVGAFFFRNDADNLQLLDEFLTQHPASLKASIEKIVPTGLHQAIGVEEWGWIEGLTGPDGVLTLAAERVRSDVSALEEARQRRYEEGRPSDFIRNTINTIKRDYLISFLSRNNVIPKYGFPVDVVSLQISHHSSEAKRLELDRDLRVALSEYAPGGQVVAAGRLWTSRYIKRLPERTWRSYRYAVCDHCGHYQRVLADAEERIETCSECGQPITGRNKGLFIVPEFGFISSTSPPGKPGESRPERTYTTQTFYSGEANAYKTISVPLSRFSLDATTASEGKLAVLNHAGYRGFMVCTYCGYSLRGDEKISTPHKRPFGGECFGRLKRVFLGHEFSTDVLQLGFLGYQNANRGFWLSLLYGLLEGASEALDIDRQDLDGCLYPHKGDPGSPSLVLFDNVPGGAGHVRRIGESGLALRLILETTHSRLSRCDCGGELMNTSCYGCLRSYTNQFCHEDLQRGPVLEFLEKALE